VGAHSIVENCGNTLILRCSSSENGGSARFASKLIGEREITREHVTTADELVVELPIIIDPDRDLEMVRVQFDNRIKHCVVGIH
jgi:hypothetical protein